MTHINIVKALTLIHVFFIVKAGKINKAKKPPRHHLILIFAAYFNIILLPKQSYCAYYYTLQIRMTAAVVFNFQV